MIEQVDVINDTDRSSGTRRWQRVSLFMVVAVIAVIGFATVANKPSNSNFSATDAVPINEFQQTPTCDAGTFLNATNQCEECPTGTYTALQGQTSCQACTASAGLGAVQCNSDAVFTGMTGCVCSNRYGFSGFAVSLEAAKGFINRFGCVGLGDWRVAGWGGGVVAYRCYIDESDPQNPTVVTEASLEFFDYDSGMWHGDFTGNGIQQPNVGYAANANGNTVLPLALRTFAQGSGLMFYYPIGPSVTFNRRFQSWAAITGFVNEYRQMGRVGHVPLMKMQFQRAANPAQMIVFTPRSFYMPQSGSYISWYYSTRSPTSGRELSVFVYFDNNFGQTVTTLQCTFTLRPPPNVVTRMVTSPATASIDGLTFGCDNTIMFYV